MKQLCPAVKELGHLGDQDLTSPSKSLEINNDEHRKNSCANMSAPSIGKQTYNTANRGWGGAQVVEHLPSKYKPQIQSPVLQKKKKTGNRLVAWLK
jgi:hypothetical protein